MIDLHTHVLPGLDDGAPDESAALELCRAAAADGTTDLVATPHYLGGVGVNDTRVVPLAAEHLRASLARHHIPLRLHYAVEMPLMETFLTLYRDGTWLAYDSARRYVLLETPPFSSRGLEIMLRTIDALCAEGVTPILAHPERLPFLDSSADAAMLCHHGALIQVTAHAFQMESGSGRRSRAWLERGLITVVATDTHSMERRPPRLSLAHAFIAAHYGEKAADDLTRANPLKILRGEPI